MNRTQLDRDRRYNATPRGRFKQQKNAAQRRGIPWSLTFEQWWSVWQASGHWEQRGKGAGKFSMGRLGDRGGYAPGNVEIVPNEVNSADRNHTHHGNPHKRSDFIKKARGGGFAPWGHGVGVDLEAEIPIPD